MANPILDANAISDLQSRMAAIEASLGKYNQANAVAGIIPSPTSGLAAASAGTPKEFSVSNNKIYFGTQVVTFKGSSISDQIKIDFPAFTESPTIVLTARVFENAAIESVAYLGSITLTGATARVKRLDGKSTGSGTLHWVAIGK